MSDNDAMSDGSNDSRKRKAQDLNEPTTTPQDKILKGTEEVSYTLQDGQLRNGKIQGATLHVVSPSAAFSIKEGDAIRLLKLADDDADEPTPHPALVVGFYTTNHDDSSFTIRVRWLIQAAELQALPADFEWRGLDRDAVLQRLTATDLVLSPQMDDLPVQSICGPTAVRLVWDNNTDKQVSNTAAWTCRFQLTVDDEQALHLDYLQRDTLADLEATGSRLNFSASRASHSSIESQSLRREDQSSGGEIEEDEDDDEDKVSDDEDEKRVVAEGEGSNLRTSIAVGPAYQATVPAFGGSNPALVTRGPAKRVWKSAMISEETLAEYLDKAAVILNGYLRTNLLTATAPYTPIPNERAEELMKAHPEEGALTGSSLSTASVLSSVRRNTLLKECDVDRLMERLHDAGGNVAEALELVEQEPSSFISTWAQFEKEMFNENFRRHHGAVRKIAKAVAPFKSISEVIDYHYRFKIPDQFRLYQERKREIAARIVECIDHRRVIDPADTLRKRPLGQTNWSESAPSDMARATQDRRETAKQLMLQAHQVLGKTVIGQVANAIKELNRDDTPAARAALFNLLRGHTDLQRRFNEFLPKQSV